MCMCTCMCMCKRLACSSRALQVRAAVANAMGVVAPPDGSACYEVGGMWLPNRISLLFSGALFWPERRRAHLERMMRNFEADLGAGFELEPLDLDRDLDLGELTLILTLT